MITKEENGTFKQTFTPKRGENGTFQTFVTKMELSRSEVDNERRKWNCQKFTSKVELFRFERGENGTF